MHAQSWDAMLYVRQVLPREFYARDSEVVAKRLLGNKLIRKLEKVFLEGAIVETEACSGLDDPASRDYHGAKRYNRPMWSEPGRVFIYNVHKYWMFNVVAHKPKQIGAVLIRALEPTKGIEILKRNTNRTGLSFSPCACSTFISILSVLKSVLSLALRARM